MKNRWLGVVALLLFTTIIKAQTLSHQVRLFGQQPDYAGYHLELKTNINSFLLEEKVLGSMYVDSTGHFDFTLPLETTTYAYTDLGKVRGEIFLEPGTEYNIQLPPFYQKSEQEKLNPFFVPEVTTLGIINSEARNLNRQISEFTDNFNFLFNNEVLAISIHSDEKKAYEIYRQLEEKFTDDTPLFVRHKALTYIKLWAVSSPRKSREIIYNHFLKHQVDSHLPSYTEAFMLLFKNFISSGFEKLVQDSLNIQLRTRANFSDLSNTIVKDTLFSHNRELGELVLLYGLYQGYYNQQLTENSVVAITDSAVNQGSTKLIKETAKALHYKLTKLRAGSPAPDFRLFNQSGKERSLKDYSGKFVYLNFVHTKNYACQRDLETLSQLQNIFKKHLEIVTIVTNEQREEMDNFLSFNNYKWDFLHFIYYPQVLSNYNIMALPAYYLISPEGKLLLSPAPSPEENFRDSFVKEIQAYERQKLREHRDRERSFFRR